MPGSSRRWLLLFTALAVLVTGAFAVGSLRSGPSAPSAAPGDQRCAAGFEPVEAALAEVRAEMRAERAAEGEESEGEESEELVREAMRELPMLRGTDPDDWDRLCVVSKRPESLGELSAMFGARAISRLAPYGSYAAGAAVHGAHQAAAMRAGSVPGTAGQASHYGDGPLIVDDPKYPEVNGLGLSDNAGRIDSYAFDPQAGRLFAAVGNGGIWRSDDLARTWRSANGNLPTSVTGAVAWTRADGGTLLALTGEPTFGSSAYTGYGAYWSSDLGERWHRASGLPSGALGFALEVDPSRPDHVYAATQLGLFGSTDGGRSYRNLRLPTGKRCAGFTDTDRRPKCALRSVVTDVVVSRGGGVGTDTAPGTVVATVGWRGGRRKNPDGSVQSKRNGIYRSKTGQPGSFRKLATAGFADQTAIGRVELGNAVGPEQDHDILYALVQDANLLNNGGVGGIDVPEGNRPPVGTTVLNGLYVSTDFGKTWTELASGSELAADPASGSALVGTGTATGYQPGVQAWYNLWVQPDPTRQSAAGVPTRLAFGLEELWSNDAADSGQPIDGSTPVHFRVVGKYFGGQSCLLLPAGLPYCPGDREPDDANQTTHPDQQDGIWIADPDVAGGVQLVVGNDGGAYRYRFEDDDDGELDNSHWGKGDQTGFSTLLPYYAVMADDGTVWAGLQDNGNMRIAPRTRKQYETYGGDGFYTAVDPDDSDIAYEEYVNADISVTTDGGTSWKNINPEVTSSKFANPFVMDPTDSNHLLTAGRQVVETLDGPETDAGHTPAADADDTTTTWIKVFDLGTRKHPGDEAATATPTDPDNSMTAVAVLDDAEYVAYCGHCDTLNKLGPKETFKNGLATNVGGDTSPRKGTDRGWHVVDAKGLPNRYVTGIAIVPGHRDQVYVTLGGYTRRWLPPGAMGDENDFLGTGHLYFSEDAGRSFRDVSGNLPDAPATGVTIRGDQLLVATDVGAFASAPNGTSLRTPEFAPLSGLPAAPVASITLEPDDPNRAVLALFGRGVWTYEFDKRIPIPEEPEPETPEVGEAYQSWNFEDGMQGWSPAGLPPWSHGSPGHGSGTAQDEAGSAWSLAGPTGYTDNADSSLTSPAVAAESGKTVLEWWMRLDTEGGFDEVAVEWSADAGATWQPVTSYSGANDDRPGWSRYTTAFSVPAAGDIQVRFHFTADEICSALGGPLCSSTGGWDGVHVDDVTVGKAAP